jgi:hypothetical protein
MVTGRADAAQTDADKIELFRREHGLVIAVKSVASARKRPQRVRVFLGDVA